MLAEVWGIAAFLYFIIETQQLSTEPADAKYLNYTFLVTTRRWWE
jgi:hypothetical protein